jgi:hypothetical protein
MTFEEWWKKESGWDDGGPLLAEGHMAKAAWNKALAEARKECIRSVPRGEAGAVGARICMEINEALMLLQSP